MSVKIGFIGLGAMGLPIAEHLQNAGYELFVGYHKNREPAERMEKSGATICSSYTEVAEKASVVFICLPNSLQVEEVLFAENGLAGSVNKELVIVDMSTIDLFDSREYADRLNKIGVEFVDAPISGGPSGAAKGTLAVMIGAQEVTYEKIKDLFSCFAKKIVYCGENGLGLAAKMANNLIASSTMVAISEALSLSIKAGIDPDKLYDVLKGATANSTILNLKVPAYLQDNYQPGFKLSLMCKDLQIITNVAKKLETPTPVASLVEQLYNIAKKNYGDNDSGAVSRVYQDLTGVSFKSKEIGDE